LAFPNRTALLGVKEGWCAEYVTAAYRRWFVGGQDASTESNILDGLREIGQTPDRVLALAASDHMKATLQTETDTAPSAFLARLHLPTGEELFWGDDRLSDAIAWHRRIARGRWPKI
jgi:2-hydroxychromene-2-carboxylate isomerase